MKRVASVSVIRHDYPGTAPTAEQTRSHAINEEPRQPACLTIEELRNLPLPPFPQGLDVTTCKVVAKIARDGFDERKKEGYPRKFPSLVSFAWNMRVPMPWSGFYCAWTRSISRKSSLLTSMLGRSGT